MPGWGCLSWGQHATGGTTRLVGRHRSMAACVSCVHRGARYEFNPMQGRQRFPSGVLSFPTFATLIGPWLCGASWPYHARLMACLRIPYRCWYSLSATACASCLKDDCNACLQCEVGHKDEPLCLLCENSHFVTSEGKCEPCGGSKGTTGLIVEIVLLVLMVVLLPPILYAVHKYERPDWKSARTTVAKIMVP